MRSLAPPRPGGACARAWETRATSGGGPDGPPTARPGRRPGRPRWRAQASAWRRSLSASQVHANQRRADRLQGPGDAAALHLRPRQGSLAPRDRPLASPPGAARGCRQARPRDRAAALRRRTVGQGEMAQAILLKDVDSLGMAGEAIDVSPGYLRNYLLPRKLAQPATDRSLEEARRRQEAAERAAREASERAEETTALLSKTVLTIQHRAGEDGKLYGSVTTKEIAEAIAEARGLKVDRKKIRLESPIREVGTYMVEVEVGSTTARIKTIVAEEK